MQSNIYAVVQLPRAAFPDKYGNAGRRYLVRTRPQAGFPYCPAPGTPGGTVSLHGTVTRYLAGTNSTRLYILAGTNSTLLYILAGTILQTIPGQ